MDDDMTSWRLELDAAMEQSDPGPIVAIAPPGIDLDKKFDGGYGGPKGEPVLIWTERYVYFPVQYDGSEWLGRAPRNPRPEPQGHHGGG